MSVADAPGDWRDARIAELQEQLRLAEIARAEREEKRAEGHAEPAPEARPVISFVEFCATVLRRSVRLTRAQSAVCTVAFDGKSPGELEGLEGEVAREVFGDWAEAPWYARRTVLLRCGRASGKSTIAAAFALYKLLTADLSACGPADTPVAMVTTPTKPLAKKMVRDARAMVEQSTELRPLVVAGNTEGFTLRRPTDRRLVQFLAIPKSRGGAAARGQSIVAAIIDESEFLPTVESENSPVKDEDIIDSIRPRLIATGVLLLTSTPWGVVSATSMIFDQNWRTPEHAIVARAPTLLMRDGDPILAAARAAMMATSPDKAAREFDVVSISPGSAFFDDQLITAAVAATAPLALLGAWHSSAGMDLGFRIDPSALVVVQRRDAKLHVVHIEERRPKPKQPLVPSHVVTDFARTARAHGARYVTCDHHYIESAREHAQGAGLEVLAGPGGVQGKLDSYVVLRELLREKRLVIPNDPRLIAQMRAVTKREQPGGGLSIISPRMAGAHGDILSALVLAAYRDARDYGPLANVYRGPPARAFGRARI